MTDSVDPVLLARARVARWVSLGLRAGYGAFGLALILFFIGFALSFPSWLTLALTVLLVVGSFVLAPAIVFNYAVKAADRADEEGSW